MIPPGPKDAPHPPEVANADPAEAFLAARRLKQQLLAEQRAAWEQGQPIPPEVLLERWPGADDDADVASVLFADFQARLEQGDQPSVAEYEQRFPQHKESLATLLLFRQFMASVPAPSGSYTPVLALPGVGDHVFGFRLCHPLGSGAFARVFLAEQADLAGRPVVLKISNTEGQEPQTLAQLQHTHIVPVHSVHEDRAAGLRALCMPYFGGASLSVVLRALWASGSPPLRGEQLVSALRQVQAPPPETLRPAERVPARTTPSLTPTPLLQLGNYTYLQAVAWTVACLADGLQHAHDRGVLHRDIKPSNILLAADGQPMVLDFNLAQDRGAIAAPALVGLGGTVDYMAPEHLRAVLLHTPELIRQVDSRADVYSLGMVLFEMLAGQSPFSQGASYSPLPVLLEAMAVERSQEAPSLRPRRPDIPWSLESIARKCLAPEPGQRYQQAEHLAADLRCFLEDRPLRHAPELSRAEQVGKWMRRNPRLTWSGSVALVAAMLLATLGFLLGAMSQHLGQTQQELERAQDYWRQQNFEAGTIRTLCLINPVADLHDHRARGQAVCADTLALYRILDREDWQDRPDWRRLAAAERQRLAEDARELLLLLAWSRVQQAPRDPKVVREALTLLGRAERIRELKPSRALWLDRANYLDKLADRAGAEVARQRADRLPPASLRDHYLLATGYARQGQYTQSIMELNRALDLNPGHFWSLMQRGLCYQGLGETTLAASDFGACVGIWPDLAWGHFNRGYVLDQSGKKAEAIAAYSAALQRDPNFVQALVNRGLAHLELGQKQESLADFDQALARIQAEAPLSTGQGVAEYPLSFGGISSPAFLHAGRGAALEALGWTVLADAAFDTAFAEARTAPESVRTRINWFYGMAVSRRLPVRARQAFEEVLQEHPKHQQALYGLALLFKNEGQETQALPFLDRALQVDPEYGDARRIRAVVNARLGRQKEAGQDINWCLVKEPAAGATLYAAACVAARAAEKSKDTRDIDQALQFLQKTFDRGYGRDRAKTDPDLASLRKKPEFDKLLSSVPGSAPSAPDTPEKGIPVSTTPAVLPKTP